MKNFINLIQEDLTKNMKKNEKYQAAVIGCGRIGAEVFNYKKEIRPATHAGAYQNHSMIKLAGLVDINQKKLKLVSKYFPGVPLFALAEEMLKEIKPDIVSIAVPTDSHLPLVKLAAKFKTKAIVCEKPIANSLKEAVEMIKICKENKSLLLVNHHRRFDPLIRDWKKKVKKGIIGKIIQGSCYCYNGLFNNGSHMVDLLIFFLGRPNWVRAVVNKKTSWKKDDKDLDALLGFKEGALATMQSLPKNYVFSDFYFYGSKGRIAIKKTACEVEYQKLIKNKHYKGCYSLSDKIEKVGRARSFMKSMANNVVDCLEGKERPYSCGEDALTVLKVLFAMRKSAENKGRIIKMKWETVNR